MNTSVLQTNTTHHYLAPAKINLFLHITSQRTDGYHTLQTVFSLLDHHDHIQISINDTGKIKRKKYIAGVPEKTDLCIRAAQALTATQAYQTKAIALGAEISVEKHIPMGGGLGGGSSNAATVLIALNHLWDLKLDKQSLIRIGLTLGADVPFFIFGQTAWAEGVGEKLTPLNLEKKHKNQKDEDFYIVLTPQIQVPTAKIFTHSGLTRDTKPLKIADFSKSHNSKLFKNDLEKVVCDLFPAVASTLAWLGQFGQAKMSGSGASVFLKVDSKQTAESILQKKPSNCYGFVAKELKYHPHFALTA